MSAAGPVTVALHRALEPWLPEVKYALGTLLDVAGVAPSWQWMASGTRTDLYYGPVVREAEAEVVIPWCGRQFGFLGAAEPDSLLEENGLTVPVFAAPRGGGVGTWPGDVVYAAFWLLTAPYESRSPRSKRDDLDLSDSFVVRHRLLERPLVSEWGHALRRQLQGADGALAPAWAGQDRVGFVFSHDVDYPEIIPWIEASRLAASGRPGSWQLASGVLSGRVHYWMFPEWIEFEREHGARGTFFFMARRGSLAQYALGTPDAFYDVTSPRFRDLFAELRDAGAEVGLHASYHAHRSADALRDEVAHLARASGREVEGNRHHYWHLDPDAPHETLRKHERAGLRYDCSLGLEYYPGFRRGSCHPFRPWHAGERRAIDVLQLPTAWMDDHFDRRQARNGVTDPDAVAGKLVAAARATGGVIVVDYHARGMNAEVFPRYGHWLRRFVENRLGPAHFMTAGEVASAWRAHTTALAASATDAAEPGRPRISATCGSDTRAVGDTAVAPLRKEEEAEWDRFVTAHPACTPYHMLAWRSVTEEGLGHASHHLRAVDDAGRIVGALPLFRVGGRSGRLVSVPMRDRGGVLAVNAAVAVKLLEAAIALARELGAASLQVRQETPLGPEVTRELDLHASSHWVTTRIDLTPGGDTVWKRLDKDAVRWAIRRAQREGVTVEEDLSAAGMERFYQLFSRTRHRMGIPPFPREFFHAIHRHMVGSGSAEVLFARRGTDDIGALVSLMSGTDVILPAYAAPQNRWRNYYPSESVFWHSMSRACERGFGVYDFGADSPDQEGLLFFKRKWGGVHRLMNEYVWQPDGGGLPALDSTSPRYALARRVWRYLPPGVSRSLGAIITRRMS